MVITIISFVLVLGVLIFIHEFGHYISAKKADIRVEEFALGFGPRLLSRKKGETIYSIRAVPLGGFCNMTGEFPPDEDEDEEELRIYNEAKERGRCFHQKSIWKRFLVACSWWMKAPWINCPGSRLYRAGIWTKNLVPFPIEDKIPVLLV